MYLIQILILFFLAVYLWYRKSKRHFAPEIQLNVSDFLHREVVFYRKLNEEKRQNFEARVADFIKKVKISGVKTEVTDEDRLLIASAAVIPIFYFEDWFYPNLEEVLLYEDNFDMDFSVETGKPVAGMVGSRFLNNKMLLSRKSLHHGFSNKTDKHNVAIHEFIHLIDKADGAIDGIPEVFMQNENIMPWLHLMYEKMEAIRNDNSDIHPYGSTNEAEFLGVAAEYFFERPDLFKRKHPELYEMMSKIFRKQS
jgi:MtfA peptidase